MNVNDKETQKSSINFQAKYGPGAGYGAGAMPIYFDQDFFTYDDQISPWE